MPLPKGCARPVAGRLVVALLALSSAVTQADPIAHQASDPAADWVFRGGPVYTLDPSRPWAEAVVVVAGRIAWVGDVEGANRWIAEGTQVVDLAGGLLLPGFHDSHMHPMAAGASQFSCPLEDYEWPREVLARLTECAAALGPNEWLRATGLDPSALQGQGPGIAWLDTAAAGRPALVTPHTKAPEQAAWVNAEALRLTGIDAGTPNPPGGEIVRDPASGKATGLLRGTALGPTWVLASAYSESALRQGLARSAQLANGFGITSASEASASAAHWAAYRAAERAGEMTLRVNASLRWDPRGGPEQLATLLDLRARADGPYFRADSVKLFLDGDCVGGTGSLLEPYAGSESLGVSVYSERLPALIARLDAAGFQVHVHAYGDRAVRDGLDAIQQAIERSDPTRPARDRRHQIAHLGLVHPDDLPRFATLGVTADIQPLWAWWNEEKRVECTALGPKRCARLLAFRDLFDAGARVVAGSDWISASMNPLYGIQVALTRRPPDGSGPAWIPEQRIGLPELLRAYTIDGAWLAGQEALTGSIEVGKAADLVVLERNLFEIDPMQIREVRVLLTLLDGRVVYEAGVIEPRVAISGWRRPGPGSPGTRSR